MATLIRGGRVIDPASGFDGTADLVVDGDRIAGIGPGLTAAGADVIEADGLLVVPGLVDPHVHLRQPGQEHKETIRSGTAAAVAGGFTTVCCMPNTDPALDTPELVTFVGHEAAQTGACRVFVVGAATRARKGEALADIAGMADAGAVGFTDDGDVIADAAMMSRALREVAAHGRVLMQHCQEPSLTRGASMHAGDVAVRQGLIGWPRVAEELIIERDIRLNRDIGCRYHVQHMSSGGSVELVRRAREAGQPVSAEASPHHLLLTHDACEGFNTNAKMNPPLREHSDVEALRQAVVDGVVTVLATDHAPHAPHEKEVEFENAPFGIIGLETALALNVEALVQTGMIDWPRLIALMTIEPARLCGLDAMGLGGLAEGGPADITLIDPELDWTIGLDDFAGLSSNSPFVGRNVRSRAVLTIVNGTERMRRERLAPA